MIQKQAIDLHNYVIDHNQVSKKDSVQIQWVNEAVNSENPFKSIIKRAMKEYGISQYCEIVQAMGYCDKADIRKKTRILTNIINEKGRTNNRDRIIAICITIGLSRSSTDFSLRSYGLSPLFDEDDRDIAIIEAIYAEKNFSETQNYLLLNHKKCLDVFEKQQPLELVEFSNHSPNIISRSEDYINKSENVDCYIDSYQNDLSSAYSPRLLTVSANACISYRSGSEIYGINYSRTQNYSGFTIENFKVFNDTAEFSTADKCPKLILKRKCMELQAKAEHAFIQAKKALDDTRNYGKRCDCRITNGSLIFYVESFDYSSPMQNTYFQMIKNGHDYVLTVTDRSEFLRYHLGDKEYFKFYEHRSLSEPLYSFTCIEDIKKYHQMLINDGIPLSYVFDKEYMIVCYENLKKIIDKNIQKLKEGTLKVFDTNVFDESHYVAAEIFNVTTAFSWHEVFPYGRFENEDCFVLKLNDGRTRKTTVEELLRAIEIGIYNMEELRMIYTKYSSLEDFIST